MSDIENLKTRMWQLYEDSFLQPYIETGEWAVTLTEIMRASEYTGSEEEVDYFTGFGGCLQTGTFELATEWKLFDTEEEAVKYFISAIGEDNEEFSIDVEIDELDNDDNNPLNAPKSEGEEEEE